jgi:hypothetical protein
VVADQQPTKVRMPHTLGHAYQGGAQQPQRMRVTVCVGEGVVASAVSDPVDHRALTRAGSFEPGHSQERNRGVVVTGMAGA